jgi:hypothetical protein
MSIEQIHRYPRRLTILVELLSAVSITVATALFGRDVLLYFWHTRGIDVQYFRKVPLLRDAVIAIAGEVPRKDLLPGAGAVELLPSLGWLAAAMLLVLLLRYSLPRVRTSARGMLVEFGGSWLPVPWENIKSIKVTDANNRFVLLAEVSGRYLTGWHRFYSLLYRLGWRPGFLITSAISDFDGLVRTLLSESDRVARVLEGARGAQLQEDASSPLFRLLISPGSFFSQRTKAEAAAVVSASPTQSRASDPVQGTYPSRITALFRGAAYLLAGLGVLRAIVLLMMFLALTFPNIRPWPVFNSLQLRVLPANWWLIVAALLVVAVLGGLASVLRYLLPNIEARNEGIAVHYFRRKHMLPWSQLTGVKQTELSDDNRVVIMQMRGSMPLPARVSSLIYDGSMQPGVLMTSALSNFEPMLQRVILEVMSGPARPARPDEQPIFQDEAQSDMLLMTLSSSNGLDQLVETARADDSTKQLGPGALLRAARPMIALALMPPLILFADRALQQGILPDMRLLIVMIILFLLGMLEWPLAAMGSIALDEMTGGGEEGNRAWYLYPVSQLPRVIALVGVLVLTTLAVPVLATLLWLGTLVWVFLLAAGLWGDLYDWRGGQLLVGGLIPVVFQLLVLIGYLALR